MQTFPPSWLRQSLRLAVFLACLPWSELSAQVVPVGSPFSVNSYATGIQAEPAIAVADDGSFVVAWTSEGSPGTDTSAASIQARRFSVAGDPIGSQFQVNAATTGRQERPRVSLDAAGRFVVSWHDDWFTMDSARARLFASSGTPSGTDILLSSAGESTFPKVAMRPSGGFISTYAHGPFDPTWIAAHRFDAAGNSLAPEFSVSATPGDYENGGELAANDQGFVVVWSSGYPDHAVRGRRFTSAGNPLGAEFLVGSPSGSLYGDVDIRTDGSFVVAWQAADAVMARRFQPDGSPSAGPFVVNATTSESHSPSVATDESGGFVISWLDSSTGWIRARRFSANGAPLGPEFSPGQSAFAPPVVAAEPGGDFVIVWMNPSADIQGQRYQVRIFTGSDAGFENGSTCGWSSVVGGPSCP